MLNNSTHFDAAMKIDDMHQVGANKELVRLGWALRGKEVYALERKLIEYEEFILGIPYDQRG